MLKNKTIRYAAFTACLIFLVCLSIFRAFETFELQTLDSRFKLRPIQKQAPDIAIIEIAQDSIKNIGRWPFDRDYHATLIETLSEYKAKAVMFDVLFGAQTPSDFLLIEFAREANNVYCPSAFRISDRISGGFIKAASYDPEVLPELAEVLKGTGHINVDPDIDGKNRRVPLFIKFKDKLYPHIALKMACDHLGLNIDDLKVMPGKYAVVSGKKIPIDEKGNVLINFAGPWAKTYKHYSYYDIYISNKQAKKGLKPNIDLNELKGKICFIGLTETGTHDLNPTPLEPRAPSVGLHANFFNMMVHDSFISRAGKFVNLLILFALSYLTWFIVYRKRTIIGFSSIIFIIGSFLAASYAVFVFMRVWIDVFYPVLVMLCVYLVTTIYKFLKEAREKLLLENELKTAKRIQQSFLPEDTPKIEGYSIVASMLPAHEVAGDLYDFVQVDSNNLGIMIGDVSGKGMPAALFMAKVISEFKFWSKVKTSPKEAIYNLNNQVSTTSKSGLFVTVAYMTINYKQNTLAYSSAGHLPIVLARERQDKPSLLEMEEGMPIGLMSETPFAEKSINLTKGDVIVLYTDGVTEAKNIKRDEFGQERLVEAVEKNKYKSVQEIKEAIEEQIKKFVGRAPQHDDITIIVVKVG